MMYVITAHAMMRMRERQISAEDLCAALEGRVLENPDGTLMHYHRQTRLGVIFNPRTKQIVTVFRLKKKQVKRWCSKKVGGNYEYGKATN